MEHSALYLKMLATIQVGKKSPKVNYNEFSWRLHIKKKLAIILS